MILQIILAIVRKKQSSLEFFKQFFQFYRDFFQEWLVIFFVNNPQEEVEIIFRPSVSGASGNFSMN
jgi:hypothetical protein